MRRILVTTAVIQFLVILALAIQLFGSDERLELEPRQVRSDEGREIESSGLARRNPLAETTPSEASLGALDLPDDKSAPAPITDARLGHVLYGSFRDELGKPLAGRVRLVPTNGKAVSDEARDGNYAVVGLGPGIWSYRFKDEGYRALEGEIEIGPEPARRFDVVLKKAVVLPVKVVDNQGQPMRDRLRELIGAVSIQAVATRAALTVDLPMTDLRDVGSFGLGIFTNAQNAGFRGKPLPEAYVGVLELTEDPPLHVTLVLRHAILRTTLVGQGEEEVVFVLDPADVEAKFASVTARVLDAATGEALSSKLKIVARMAGWERESQSEDGRHDLDRLMPGMVDLFVASPGLASFGRFLRLEAGKNLDLGEIRLHPAASLTLHMVAPDGAPMKSKVISFALDEMTFPQPMLTYLGASTKEDGSFTFDRLPPGRRLVIAFGDDGRLMAWKVIAIESGSSLELELPLEPTVPVELAIQASPGDFFLVRVQTRDGIPVFARWSWGTAPWRLSLPAGPYRLDLFRDLELVNSREFRVAGAGPIQVRLP